MAQVDSENSTVVPAKPSAGAAEKPAGGLYFPADISPEDLLEALERIRTEAENEIERLIDLLDKTDPFFDEREHQVDDGAIDEDDGLEDSLGFLENHPTDWHNGRDSSGSQVHLCGGLSEDREDGHDDREPQCEDEGAEHDGREPDVDGEASLGWTDAEAAEGLACAGTMGDSGLTLSWPRRPSPRPRGIATGGSTDTPKTEMASTSTPSVGLMARGGSATCRTGSASSSGRRSIARKSAVKEGAVQPPPSMKIRGRGQSEATIPAVRTEMLLPTCADAPAG